MSPGIARMVLSRMRPSRETAELEKPRPSTAEYTAPGPLTARETEVLRLLSRGYTYSEVADRLDISVHTVTSHIKNSYRKLAVHSATAALVRATELHFFDRR